MLSYYSSAILSRKYHSMETKQGYYQTSPEFVKLKVECDEPTKPVSLATSELIKMIIFLFLGLGCLGVTAYVYTQSKVTAKESHQVILQNRTGSPPQTTNYHEEPLFFKPYHIVVIRIHSPLNYFNDIARQLNQADLETNRGEETIAYVSEAEVTDWSSTSTYTSTTSSPETTSSSEGWPDSFTDSYSQPVDWIQNQFNMFQEQMEWMNKNFGFGWLQN